MSVVTKNRRKLIREGQLYIWYVKPDDDYYDNLVLHIVSSDKRLILAYPLGCEKPYVVSKGRIFQGKCSDGRWHRYLSPAQTGLAVTPQDVANLIDWAVKGDNAEEISWNGGDIWL